MLNSRWLLSGVCLALVPALAPAARALATFGVHRQATPEAAPAQAADWLKSVGQKPCADFEAIWASDRSVFDCVADTLALGSPEAARILAEARDGVCSSAHVTGFFTSRKRGSMSRFACGRQQCRV